MKIKCKMLRTLSDPLYILYKNVSYYFFVVIIILLSVKKHGKYTGVQTKIEKNIYRTRHCSLLVSAV